MDLTTFSVSYLDHRRAADLVRRSELIRITAERTTEAPAPATAARGRHSVGFPALHPAHR